MSYRDWPTGTDEVPIRCLTNSSCDADISEVARTPDDEACRELLVVHSAFYGKLEDESAFFGQMIDARRLVVRLRARRLYGVLLDKPPGT